MTNCSHQRLLETFHSPGLLRQVHKWYFYMYRWLCTDHMDGSSCDGAGLWHGSPKTVHVASREFSITHLFGGIRFIFVSVFQEPIYKYLCMSWASLRWWRGESPGSCWLERTHKEPKMGWEWAVEQMRKCLILLNRDSQPRVWTHR